jgi:Protein of unknown function (DUF2924)
LSPTSDLTEQLHSLDRAGLLELWHKSFSRPASPGLRRELMLPILAFRIQELALGGLKPETKANLREISGSLNPEGQKARQSFRAGTKLVREWKGKVHEVLITADGFEYLGEAYRSLSPIACRITGAHWSGPAFFGTKRGKKTR